MCQMRGINEINEIDEIKVALLQYYKYNVIANC